jgi:ankyrin repeat protein
MDIDLFQLIKSHNYDEIKKILNLNNNIDLNILDKSDIYFIEYIIMYNNVELLALVLTKNIKLDILTNEGMSILYYPIKFGYYDIVQLLLYFNNIKIGISLLDIVDKYHKIPIYYAIEFNNIDTINLILKYNFNYNIKDNEDNTYLHYAITKKNINIIKLLLNKKINYNIRNKNGYTAINLAISYELTEIVEILLQNNVDLSIKDDIYQITPLLNAFYNNNINIIKLLMNHNVDYNDQDNKGNSILFYIIYNKNLELYNMFINKVNLNLVNVDGDNILSYLLKSDINKNDYSKYYISKLLSQCNLNIQDINGNTIWHKLIEDDLWINYIDILSKTKNKIFIPNHKNISSYDIFITKKYDTNTYGDKFFKMIYDSYYNFLINNKKEKYTNKIDIECIKTNYDYEKCIKILEKTIIKNKISSPILNKGYCIEIKIDNTNFVTYTGKIIDVLIGIIYLKKKYNNICTSLNTNLKINDNLLDYYENIGIYRNIKYDFINFEILWIYQKIFIPNELSNIINKFKKNKKLQYLIIPIGIELSKGGHANILLYDKKTNELERFEPYGKDFPINFNYIPNLLDKHIFDYFSTFFDDLIYLPPSKYQDKVGPQLLDTNELQKYKNIGDPNGYCAAWSLWYVDMRLQYHNVSRNEIIKKLINKYKYNNISIRSIIRNYIKNITDLRDKYFIKIDTDINHWINLNVTKKQHDELLELLYKDINKLLC